MASIELQCPNCQLLPQPDPDCSICGGDGTCWSCPECNEDGSYDNVNPLCAVCGGEGNVPNQSGGGGMGGGEIK